MLLIVPFNLLSNNFWVDRIKRVDEMVSSNAKIEYIATADVLYASLASEFVPIDLCMNSFESLPTGTIILIDGYTSHRCQSQLDIIKDEISAQNLAPIISYQTDSLVELDRYINQGEQTDVYFLE